MKAKLTGQCLCGAVRYQFDGTVKSTFLCHCRDCQRSSGSHFHHGIMVEEAGFTLHGETTSYKSQSDAGRWITREFCGVCGSGVLNRLEMTPGLVVLKVGTLDDPSVLPPQSEVFARSKASWIDCGELKSFATLPGAKS